MPDDVYVIWSYEHGAWWRPGRMGYTPDLREAGHYSRHEAEAIVANANFVKENETMMTLARARILTTALAEGRPLYYVLDEAGEPLTIPEARMWASWFETHHPQRQLARTVFHEGEADQEVIVSTVFLGLDHAFGSGPPVLWESMVFGGLFDGEQRRYRSKAEALTGHADLCQQVSEHFTTGEP